VSNSDQGGGSWTLLTGHGHVLVEIARHPDARIRDISPVVGLTERTVQVIVADLEAAGYLTRARTGRRTRYTVNHDSLFRHPAQEGLRVGPFLALLTEIGADDQGHADPQKKRTRRRTGSALSRIASGARFAMARTVNLHTSACLASAR
jgi:MarR family